jgi:phytoene synthase
MSAEAIATEEEGGTAAQRALGSSFYAAMRIMPRAQREAMFEIYSFCRAVDDIADDQGPSAGRLEALQRWRDDIDAIYRGEAPPARAGLAVAVRDFQLRREDFLAVIAGMEMDVTENVQAPDFVTLDLYCDRVASAVGRLSVRVFGLPPEDGDRLAQHLGRALQLTNILRDLDEDAALNRLYLPREFLAGVGIQSTDPNVVLADPRLPEVCGRVVALARQHFAEADAIMSAHPKRFVRTPLVMSEAYKSILKALVERGWAAPRDRVRLSKTRLVLILIRRFVF